MGCTRRAGVCSAVATRAEELRAGRRPASRAHRLGTTCPGRAPADRVRALARVRGESRDGEGGTPSGRRAGLDQDDERCGRRQLRDDADRPPHLRVVELEHRPARRRSRPHPRGADRGANVAGGARGTVCRPPANDRGHRAAAGGDPARRSTARHAVRVRPQPRLPRDVDRVLRERPAADCRAAGVLGLADEPFPVRSRP